MQKVINKRQPKRIDRARAWCVRKLAENYGVSTVYIGMCLRGEAKSVLADEVKKEYKILYEEANKFFNK